MSAQQNHHFTRDPIQSRFPSTESINQIYRAYQAYQQFNQSIFLIEAVFPFSGIQAITRLSTMTFPNLRILDRRFLSFHHKSWFSLVRSIHPARRRTVLWSRVYCCSKWEPSTLKGESSDHTMAHILPEALNSIGGAKTIKYIKSYDHLHQPYYRKHILIGRIQRGVFRSAALQIE